MHSNIQEQASIYLKRVARSYSFGIPIELLRQAKSDKLLATNEKVRILFAYPLVDSQGRKTQDIHLEILKAAVEKGLSRNIAEQVLLSVELGSGTNEFIQTVEKLHAEKAITNVFLLGKDLKTLFDSLASTSSLSGISIVLSDSLIEVASNIAVKKQFWKDLQPLKT